VGGRVYFKGLVRYSPVSIDNELLWRNSEITLTDRTLNFSKNDRVLISIPYTQIYSVDLSKYLENTLVRLRFINVDRLFDEILIATSNRILNNIFKMIQESLIRDDDEPLVANKKLESKILYLLHKKISFNMIAYLLDLSKDELVYYLNKLRLHGLIDSRGNPTPLGFRIIRSLYQAMI